MGSKDVGFRLHSLGSLQWLWVADHFHPGFRGLNTARGQ